MWSLSAGYVLVGGRSTRMGRDKALLPWPRITAGTESGALAVHVARVVFEAAGNVTLIGDPERYRHLGFDAIPDIHPGLGPLAGVEAALRHTESEWNLIVACDLPNLDAEFLRMLLIQNGNVVAAEDGNAALCGVFRKDCLADVSRAIAANKLSWNAFVDSIGALRIAAPRPSILANLNTPKDLATHE